MRPHFVEIKLRNISPFPWHKRVAVFVQIVILNIGISPKFPYQCNLRNERCQLRPYLKCLVMIFFTAICCYTKLTSFEKIYLTNSSIASSSFLLFTEMLTRCSSKWYADLVVSRFLVKLLFRRKGASAIMENQGQQHLPDKNHTRISENGS